MFSRNKIVEVLSRRWVIELMIVLSLKFCHIFDRMHNGFDRKYVAPPVEQAPVGPRSQAKSLGETAPITALKFPKLPQSIIIFDHFVNVYLIYSVTKYTCPRLLEVLVGALNLPMPTNCYIMGRLIFQEFLANQMALAFTLLQLAWRGYQCLKKGPELLGLYSFLLLQEEDLTNFSKLLVEQQKSLDRARTNLCHCSMSTASGPRCRAIQTLGQEKPPQSSTSRRTPVRRWESHARDLRGDSSEPEEIERVFDLKQNSTDAPMDSMLVRACTDILCYQVKFNSHFYYRMRPNRTADSRRVLLRRISLSAFTMGVIFVAVTGTIMLIVSIVLLRSEEYARLYPGCDPRLERHPELANWEEVALSWHFIIRYLFDITENLILQFTSAIYLFVSCTSIYLLNFDNLIYWRHLEKKLNRIKERVCGEPTLEAWQLPASSIRNSSPASVDLEDAIYELQLEFADFFHQIAESDQLISSVILFAILTWISLFTTMGHYSLSYYSLSKDPTPVLLVGLLLLYTLIFLTAGTLSLLETHRSCLKSYPKLCSLAVYDRSCHRLGFLKLLEFFSVQKRSAYTFAQNYPYTMAVYISIFGWSLSGFFILDGLMSR